jgi:hypothetical protein
MELTEAWEIVKKQKGNVRLLQAEQDKDGVWVIVYAPVTPGPVVCASRWKGCRMLIAEEEIICP